MKKLHELCMLSCLAFAVIVSAPAGAQAPADTAVPADETPAVVTPPVDPAAAAAAAAEAAAQKAAAEKAPFRGSLLFSGAEVQALREAVEGRQSNTAFLEADTVELIPIDRKIKLSGIYYKNDATWIIWMNGYKLWPGYLLPEIHGINVKKDRIDLRWYDIGLNDVIEVTLRPNQIYDIVTGIVYNDTAGGTK